MLVNRGSSSQIIARWNTFQTRYPQVPEGIPGKGLIVAIIWHYAAQTGGIYATMGTISTRGLYSYHGYHLHEPVPLADERGAR